MSAVHRKYGRMRLPEITSSLLLSSLFLTMASSAFADAAREMQLPAGELTAALETLARQGDVQLVYRRDELQGIKTNGAVGRLTAQDAVKKLIEGTNLRLSTDETGAMLIAIPAAKHTRPVGAAGCGKAPCAHETIRLAQAGNEAANEPDSSASRGLEEVIVTATKRRTTLQDTPMSVSVIGATEIDQRGLVGMADYLNSVPSVTVLDQGAGRTTVVMRGLAANAQTDPDNGPLVGVYFGEIPISGLGTFGGTADIKMVDLERVEVLRGPQGTLYGSSSLGGTVRNIPAAPNLQQLEGNVRVSASDTTKFGGGNSEIKGVVSIPLIADKLAVRIVGYRYKNSGYYKNVAASDPVTAAAAVTYGAVALDVDHIGRDEYTGGRVSVLWEPTDAFSVRLNYLKQDIDQEGWPQADLELGNRAFLQRRFQIRRSDNAPDFAAPQFNEQFGETIEIPNVTLEYDLGWASLLSSSSWIDQKTKMFRELSALFGYAPWDQPNWFTSDAFVQEVRLVSQLPGRIQFVAGAYYEDVSSNTENWGIWGGDPSTNIFGGPDQLTLVNGYFGNDREQKALFGELSFQLNDRLKLTAGARAFSFDRVVTADQRLAALSPAYIDISKSKESDVNYKAGVDFAPDPRTLLYASWSQGFRLGRPVAAIANPVCDQDGDGFFDGSGGVSTGAYEIHSDFVDSYELGAKRSFLNRRLQLNAALFKWKWDGLPVFVQFDLCGTTLNAGKAESRGAEFEGSYYLRDGLLLSLGASYIHAELTEDADFLGSAGDRLPGSPRFSFHTSLQQDFTIASRKAFLRADYSHIGGFYNNLQETGSTIGDYGLLSVRTGVYFGTLGVELFGNNLSNEDALTWMDSEGFGRERGNLLRPRTIGVSVTKSF